jgi:hypothetical protein
VQNKFLAKKEQLFCCEGLRPIAASIKEGLPVLESIIVLSYSSNFANLFLWVDKSEKFWDPYRLTSSQETVVLKCHWQARSLEPNQDIQLGANHSSSQQRMDQQYYVLTLNFETPQVAYF